MQTFGPREMISLGICRRCDVVVKVDVERGRIGGCEVALFGSRKGSVAALVNAELNLLVP
jgi:hypothetical protein